MLLDEHTASVSMWRGDDNRVNIKIGIITDYEFKASAAGYAWQGEFCVAIIARSQVPGAKSYKPITKAHINDAI